VKLWPLGLYRVAGHSMQPTYQPGDLLLGWRWFRPRVGQVVVAQLDVPVIKRIAASTPGGFRLTGDNAADSRDYPDVPRRAIEARIVRRLGYY
jgi:signal peptidase I